MMTKPPLKYPRRRHGRIRPRAAAAPVAALTLLEASFDEGGPSVRLGFDRAIDIAGVVGSAITVDAGNVTGTRYEALGTATLDGPNAVVIGLVATVPSASGDTLLTAGAGNGIVAIDDGGTWGGVTELVLPFP